MEEGGPKYRALADAIERDVFSGGLKPGDRLPTHRELADVLGVNVSTITRGYAEAERRGVVSGAVGRGTFVSSDAATSTSMVSFEPNAPGMIEMGLVYPYYSLDPDIREGMRRLIRRRDPAAFMRYSDPRGLPEHRKAGAAWLARYGLDVSPENVIACSGAQHALTCCLGAFFRAGDRVAADSLTYPGMKTLAAMLGIRLTPVDMDEDGMIPESLDTACRRESIQGLYLMPGMQNPTTIGMPAERREALARVAERRSLLVIEDDAYELTAGGGAPPVASFLPERSLYIAGLSKCLGAGLRVAFAAAARGDLRRELAKAVLNTVWMTAPINVELAAQWIMDGTADRTVERKRGESRRRFDIAGDSLGGLRFQGRRTGLFLWLELPESRRGRSFETRARELGVNVFGAEKFAVGGARVPAGARISLSGPRDADELRRGLSVLRELIRNP